MEHTEHTLPGYLLPDIKLREDPKTVRGLGDGWIRCIKHYVNSETK